MTKALCLAFLLVGIALPISACGSASELKGSGDPGYYERHEHKKKVLVFVHGIYGSADDSWTCPRTKISWPKLLQGDAAFADFDIYVAKFPSHVTGNLMNLNEIVTNLYSRLEGDQVFETHDDVMFVAHSLGGLVVERLLTLHRSLATKVRFVNFYGTPFEGADFALLGYLNNDPLLKQLIPGDQNVYLESLREDWRSAGVSIVRNCAAERKKTFRGIFGDIVVSRTSASSDCAKVVDIDENHMLLVKPCTRDDDSYVALSNAIREQKLSSAGPKISNGPKDIQHKQEQLTAPHQGASGAVLRQPEQQQPIIQNNVGGINIAGGTVDHPTVINNAPHSRELSDGQVELFSKVLSRNGVHSSLWIFESRGDDIAILAEQLCDAAKQASWTCNLLPSGTFFPGGGMPVVKGIECHAVDWKLPEAALFTEAMTTVGLNCSSIAGPETSFGFMLGRGIAVVVGMPTSPTATGLVAPK